MEAPLQQRIVGAIVLVTLGVIFIPALLDGSGHKARQAKDIVIREKPEFPPLSQKKLDPVPTPLNSKASSKVKSDQGSELSLKTRQSSKPSPGKTVVANKTVIKKPAPNRVETNKPKPVAKPKPTTKDPVTKDKVAAKTTKDKKKEKKPIKSFAIQVGTFDSNENAEKVRDKLRKAGYTAYIQKSKSKTKPAYRVRIGPELDYDVLEKLLVKLKKTKKIDGYIVNHP